MPSASSTVSPGTGSERGLIFQRWEPGRNLRVPASTANSELHRTTHKHTASKPIAMNFPTLDGRKDTLRFIFRERFRCAEYCFLLLLLLFRAILPNPPTKLSSLYSSLSRSFSSSSPGHFYATHQWCRSNFEPLRWRATVCGFECCMLTDDWRGPRFGLTFYQLQNRCAGTCRRRQVRLIDC